MKVNYLTDKGSRALNEDSLLISKNLFGVFDGATGLIKYTNKNGSTGGLFASQTTRNVFKKNHNKPFLPSVKEANMKIRRGMMAARIHMNDKAGFWSTSASVVRINEKSVEFIRIGDSPIAFVNKRNKFKTSFVDHDLSSYILWKKLAEEGVKDIRNDRRMQNEFFENRKKTNVAYGMLNGEKEAINFVETGSVPKKSLKYVLIFSDGMLIPRRNPHDPEDFKTIINLFAKGGLEKVHDYIRKLEDSDPECKKYLRFKPHDDLTAVAIIL